MGSLTLINFSWPWKRESCQNQLPSTIGSIDSHVRIRCPVLQIIWIMRQIVLHMLYIYFIAVNQNMMYTDVKYVTVKIKIKSWSVLAVQCAVIVVVVAVWRKDQLSSNHSRQLCSTVVHVNTLKSKLILGQFLLSITLKLIDVREQTQRKQSSKPKPLSEFSASV